MTDMLVAEKLHTVESLMALGSDARIEFIERKIVEMSPLGGLHHFIGGNIYRALDRYAQETGYGCT